MLGDALGSDRSIAQGRDGNSNWNKDPHKMSLFAVNAQGLSSTRSIKRRSSKLMANLELSGPKVKTKPFGRQSTLSRKATLEGENKLPRLSVPTPFVGVDKNGASKTFNFSGANPGDSSKDARNTLGENTHMKPGGPTGDTRQRRGSITQARNTPTLAADDPLNPKSTDPKNRTSTLSQLRRKSTINGVAKRKDGSNTLAMNL